jgi:hypothetical protein
MSYTHILNSSARVGSDAVPANQSDADITIEAASQTRLAEPIPGASTDLEIPLAVDVSALKSLIISADRDMTIETNSGSAADATINLRADEPLIWHSNAYFSNPFGATDVTSIFVTLAAGDASVLTIETLQDPTP